MDANGAVQVPPELQAVWPQVEVRPRAKGRPMHPRAAGPLLPSPRRRTLTPAAPHAQAYVNARIQQFAGAFARRVNLNVAPQQLDALVSETLSSLAQPGAIVSQANRQLRLVLRHDCQ